MKNFFLPRSLLVAILLVGQLSQAHTFFCTGRDGAFQLDEITSGWILTRPDGQKCELPQDESFNASERGYFQVMGAYDNREKAIRDLDLPELISPEGYLAYGGNRRTPASPECAAIFGDKVFRNLYVQAQMKGPEPQNFYDTVISVFVNKKGWPDLFLNFCVAKKAPQLLSI